MKTLTTMAAAVALAVLSTAAQAATVTLNIKGFEARGGHVLVSLQTREQYMGPVGAGGVILPGDKAGARTITLNEIPNGEYAFTVLHDADDNHDMTMNGSMPGEGWATKNTRALTGKPVFDQVKFTVRGDTALTETMLYYPAK